MNPVLRHHNCWRSPRPPRPFDVDHGEPELHGGSRTTTPGLGRECQGLRHLPARYHRQRGKLERRRRTHPRLHRGRNPRQVGLDLLHARGPRAGSPRMGARRGAPVGRASDDRWHVRKGGQRFWCSGILTKSTDEDGTLRGFVKAMRNLTERKDLEDELRRQAEELREADRRKNEFLAMLSHELRSRWPPSSTPFTSSAARTRPRPRSSSRPAPRSRDRRCT